MRKNPVTAGIFVLFLCIAAAAAASTSTVTVSSQQDAATQIYISGVDLDPPVFFPDEPGTITIHVTNPSNQTVVLSSPAIINPNINLINKDTYQSKTNIGPGVTVDYYFIASMDPPDGTYLPLFTITPVAGNSIHATFRIEVDSTNIRASISQKPDNFALSKKDTVNVSVINPRNGDVTDVLIVADGVGTDVSPLESYVGTLKAGDSVEVPFAVTPSRETNLTFRVYYNNGNNKHEADAVLPVTIAKDKTAVVPVINNLAVTAQGSTYQITGDVSNAGISDAKSMLLTVESPAKAVEPYAEYAIGSLASDDFSSFELTFVSSDLSSVPLRIQWKDSDGNTFSTVQNLNLQFISGGTGSRTGSSATGGSAGTSSGTSSVRTAGGPSGGGGVFSIGGNRGGGLSAFYPVITGGIIVVIGIIVWFKRKWILVKLKKQ